MTPSNENEKIAEFIASGFPLIGNPLNVKGTVGFIRAFEALNAKDLAHQKELEYAQRFFKCVAPHCEPMENLTGIIDQIDSFTAGSKKELEETREAGLELNRESVKRIIELEKEIKRLETAMNQWLKERVPAPCFVKDGELHYFINGKTYTPKQIMSLESELVEAKKEIEKACIRIDELIDREKLLLMRQVKLEALNQELEERADAAEELIIHLEGSENPHMKDCDHNISNAEAKLCSCGLDEKRIKWQHKLNAFAKSKAMKSEGDK